MDKLNQLAEQHVLESESRLRHIDELMDRARGSLATKPALTETEALLERIQATRDKLAQDLNALRQAPLGGGVDIADRGAEVTGLLGSLGLQLEEALRAIVESDTDS